MEPTDRNAVVLFWSAGGNTRKAAEAVAAALGEGGLRVEIQQITPDLDVDYRHYLLTILAVPVYHYLPPKPAMDFLHRQQRQYGRIEPSAPEIPGRYGVALCTLGGPHTGFREAVPTLKYVGQFFEHSGIRVVEEWAVVGEFHEPFQHEMNVRGRLGDIQGRPNDADLAELRGKVAGLLRKLQDLPGFAQPGP